MSVNKALYQSGSHRGCIVLIGGCVKTTAGIINSWLIIVIWQLNKRMMCLYGDGIGRRDNRSHPIARSLSSIGLNDFIFRIFGEIEQIR